MKIKGKTTMIQRFIQRIRRPNDLWWTTVCACGAIGTVAGAAHGTIEHKEIIRNNLLLGIGVVGMHTGVGGLFGLWFGCLSPILLPVALVSGTAVAISKVMAGKEQ